MIFRENIHANINPIIGFRKGRLIFVCVTIGKNLLREKLDVDILFRSYSSFRFAVHIFLDIYMFKHPLLCTSFSMLKNNNNVYELAWSYGTMQNL